MTHHGRFRHSPNCFGPRCHPRLLATLFLLTLLRTMRALFSTTASALVLAAAVFGGMELGSRFVAVALDTTSPRVRPDGWSSNIRPVESKTKKS